MTNTSFYLFSCLVTYSEARSSKWKKLANVFATETFKNKQLIWKESLKTGAVNWLVLKVR